MMFLSGGHVNGRRFFFGGIDSDVGIYSTDTDVDRKIFPFALRGFRASSARGARQAQRMRQSNLRLLHGIHLQPYLKIAISQYVAWRETDHTRNNLVGPRLSGQI